MIKGTQANLLIETAFFSLEEHTEITYFDEVIICY